MSSVCSLTTALDWLSYLDLSLLIWSTSREGESFPFCLLPWCFLKSYLKTSTDLQIHMQSVISVTMDVQLYIITKLQTVRDICSFILFFLPPSLSSLPSFPLAPEWFKWKKRQIISENSSVRNCIFCQVFRPENSYKCLSPRERMTLQISATYAIFLISLLTEQAELQDYVAVNFLSIKKEWRLSSSWIPFVQLCTRPWISCRYILFIYLWLVVLQNSWWGICC